MPEHARRPTGAGPSDPISSAPGVEFYLDAHGIVRTTLRAAVTLEDLIAHALTRAATGFEGYPQLLDAREAQLAITTRDVKHIAAVAKELRARGPVGRSALVAPADLEYGMGRMFAAYDGPDNDHFAVFRTLEEAEAWLVGGMRDRASHD